MFIIFLLDLKSWNYIHFEYILSSAKQIYVFVLIIDINIFDAIELWKKRKNDYKLHECAKFDQIEQYWYQWL